MFNVEDIRKDFPILSRRVNNRPLIYLDNAASAQKPKTVLDSISKSYSEEYANVHRGLHYLSNLATDQFESVRGKIRKFINAEFDDEIIYTTSSTEAINLAAYGWGTSNLGNGDEVILTVMEHHANIVPWHMLRERNGIRLKWIELEDDGGLDPNRVIEEISSSTKLIAITQMSNVLGTRVDIKTIAKAAQEKGVAILVDGSQSTVHDLVDVKDLGVDFFAFTGHKLYAPSASGALYARRFRQIEMSPFHGGGNMIREVRRNKVSFANPPQMFEAGTPPIVQMIGLGAALDYLQEIGMENIANHESEIAAYASKQFAKESWINLQGTSARKAAIFSFTLDCPAHPHDISTILDQQGIAIRAGHHCAQPLMDYLGVTATCRASFGLYNTKDEVDRLIEGLRLCQDLFS